MTSIIKTTLHEITRFWELRDKRVDDWPLMSSPIMPIVICLAYVYVVKIWGPQYMKDRPAYKLKEALLVYNLFQIVSNGWLFYELGRYGWLSGNYSFTCQPVDYSNSESALRMLRASYLFYILKFFDLIDTFFFVLRKKFSQITTLYVIHHGLIVVNTWPGARFVFGGHATFFYFSQHVRSRRHVLLLLHGSDGTTLSKIPRLEETSHHPSDHTIRRGIDPLFPVDFHRM
ncbi:elongation of very long chain fatty acids protein AAEL008004-like [Daphnia pulex]|uniref:elongation of very long chain fatty acids protein AAEL008004-like n=1 Tax=Daphnia pulex TaxID=6669 RepID=UPI001EDE1EB4|nr:elongation of very long chain fatty acids protein AAEL008004-like [Daphnia pulex]